LYPPRGRLATLAPRFDQATTHVAWTPDSAALLFTSEAHGRQGLWRLPIDGGGAMPAEIVPGGAVGGFAQSRSGDVLAFDRASAMHPAALFACRADGTGEVSLEALNASCSPATRWARSARSPSAAGAARRSRSG
jgi:hypothetical protein